MRVLLPQKRFTVAFSQTLELQRFWTVSKSYAGFDFPWSKLRGVRTLTIIVVGETLANVFSKANVKMRRRGNALEDINVIKSNRAHFALALIAPNAFSVKTRLPAFASLRRGSLRSPLREDRRLKTGVPSRSSAGSGERRLERTGFEPVKA